MRINRLIALIQVSARLSLLGAAPSPSAGVDDAQRASIVSVRRNADRRLKRARAKKARSSGTSMGLTDFPKIVGAFEKTFPT